MKESISAVAFVAVTLASGAASAQSAAAQGGSVSIKAGLWETTTIIEDSSTKSKRSIVGRTCVGAADVSNLARIVPAQREFGMRCENSDLKRDGTNVVWVISCKSNDTTQTGKGRISLFGDSYLGTAEVDLRKHGGKPVKLTQSFSGKWLQACG
jgi:Protein of unknown function (DUF3617)